MTLLSGALLGLCLSAVSGVGPLQSTYSSFDLEIPSDALPPGAVELRVTDPDFDAGRGFRHLVETQIEPHHTLRARLFASHGAVQWSDGARVEVVAKSETGKTWTTSIPSRSGGVEGGVAIASSLQFGFVGSAQDLAEFSAVLSERATEQFLIEKFVRGVRLLPSMSAPDCARLRDFDVVILPEKEARAADAYVDCAAQGAHLLFLGTEVSSSSLDLGATTPVGWGAGRVMRVPANGEAIVPLIAKFELAGEQEPSHLGAETVPLKIAWSLRNGLIEPDGKRAPSIPLILGLLAFHILLIGALGFLVGVRPRRALYAWGWFPAISCGFVGLVAFGGRTWNIDAPELSVERIELSAPTGVGIALMRAQLRGVERKDFELSVPKMDGELFEVRPPEFFGSPLARPPTPMTLHEHDMRLTVKPFTAGRFTGSTFAWSQVLDDKVPYVERRKDGSYVVNPRSDGIRRGLLITSHGVAWFEDLGPNSATPVEIASLDGAGFGSPVGESTEEMLGPFRSVLRDGVGMGDMTTLGSSYVLLTDSRDAEPGLVSIHPPARITARTFRITAGPMPRSDEELSP